jgi:hypothetical protein
MSVIINTFMACLPVTVSHVQRHHLTILSRPEPSRIQPDVRVNQGQVRIAESGDPLFQFRMLAVENGVANRPDTVRHFLTIAFLACGFVGDIRGYP